jgi:hypothetical protein
MIQPEALDIGDRVLYVLPGCLRVRPAVIVEGTSQAATLRVDTLPEDAAFAPQYGVARDVRHDTHRLGNTWHWPPHGARSQAAHQDSKAHAER